MSLVTDDSSTPGRAQPAARGVAAISSRLRETLLSGAASQEETVIGNANADRWMLWVDGVGGYLVTLADELTIGRPTSESRGGPNLPVLADLSSTHAKLARVGGGHVLTPYADAMVNGRPIEGPTLISDGATISLGSVELAFRRPHALSSSAVLTVESGHRTAPASDGVLLMAESCVLGPKPHSHIRCNDWEAETLLFRGPRGLVCRSTGDLSVGGSQREGPVEIEPGARIATQDFTFCVEQVNEA